MLHIYNVILVYKNLCELQEFVISNKIFYVDSSPFFPREFLRFSFSTTGFQTQEISWDCFYSQLLLLSSTLPQQTRREEQASPGILFVV